MQIIIKINKLKKMYIYFISYVLFIILFSTTFLNASTFKISDIEISEPFELNFNKNKVIDNGFIAAFSNLISMITTSGDKERVKNISLNQIKGMIDSFTISDEKFVNDEYSAKFEVTFNKKNILKFLEEKNIFPSIPIKNKVLLVPILIDTNLDNVFLYTENIFYQKWNSDNKNYHLLNYLLPNEDLEDLNNIQQNLKTLEDFDFTNIIKKYDLRDYIIVILFKDSDGLKVLSKINLNNSFKIDNKIFNNVNLKKKEDIDNVLKKLKITYENYWKLNNQINSSIKFPITISINSNEYSKIENLEKNLTSSDLISNFYILKFDNKDIFYKIIYNGSPKTFLNNMRKNNIELSMDKNIWTVK